MTQMEDGPLAAALGLLPQLTALQLGATPAGDATLEALTFAHRAAAWSETYGACLRGRLDTVACFLRAHEQTSSPR